MTMTKAAVGNISLETIEIELFGSSLRLPRAYQTKKVAIAIRIIETRKCAPTIQEFRPVRTVIPPRIA
jgi:hypothetical protein